MSEQRRRSYRSDPGAGRNIEVEIIHQDRAVPAQVLDVSAGGLGLFIAEGGSVDIGKIVQVRLNSPCLEKPLVEYAKVRHAVDFEGGKRIGVQFIDWLGLLERLPMGLCELFNRRSSPRCRAQGEEEVSVYYENEGAAVCVEGKLSNLSPNGLAFLADPLNASRLLRADLVLVSFPLPGTDEYLSFRAQLRHLREQGDQWLIGAYFDEEGYKFEERKKRLEAYIAERTNS